MERFSLNFDLEQSFLINFLSSSKVPRSKSPCWPPPSNFSFLVLFSSSSVAVFFYWFGQQGRNSRGSHLFWLLFSNTRYPKTDDSWFRTPEKFLSCSKSKLPSQFFCVVTSSTCYTSCRSSSWQAPWGLPICRKWLFEAVTDFLLFLCLNWSQKNLWARRQRHIQQTLERVGRTSDLPN